MLDDVRGNVASDARQSMPPVSLPDVQQVEAGLDIRHQQTPAGIAERQMIGVKAERRRSVTLCAGVPAKPLAKQSYYQPLTSPAVTRRRAMAGVYGRYPLRCHRQ